MTALAVLLAAVLGLVLGLLGGGGSVLAVPMFVYGLHLHPKQAIAMSLLVVGLTSLLGALAYWRDGLVDLRRGLLFGALAMAGAYSGARAAMLLDGSAQLLILAVAMAGAAISMLRHDAAAADAAGPRPRHERVPLLVVAAAAFGIGVVTGLAGIGGGFLFVPALVLLGTMPVKQAIGTSLVAIAMNAAAGFAGYVGTVDVRWDLVFVFSGIAAAGVLAGHRVVHVVPQRGLQRLFGVVLLAVAALMLCQEAPIAGGRPAPPVAREAAAPLSAAAR